MWERARIPMASRYGAASKLQAVVRRALARNMETKHSNNHTSTDDARIGHNSFIIMDGDVLETSQGVGDNMNAGTNNRFGDEITLKGISLKFMVELNERYSDVTFRMFLVQKPKKRLLMSVRLVASVLLAQAPFL